MKTTGMIRRIDDLGRIVIPKEIRKNLHIKDGESLEIFLEEEKIVLQKHSMIKQENILFNHCVNAISLKLKCEVYVTNLDKLLFSSLKNKEIGQGKEISEFLETIISRRGFFSETTKKDIQLTANDKTSGYFEIRPISPNGDIEGLVIFVFKNPFDTELNKLIDFMVMLLQTFLEK